MLMQNFGATIKKHYGMLWYFLEWPIFERGAKQRSDLNNNFWLDFLTARAHVLRKNKGCLPRTLRGIWDL